MTSHHNIHIGDTTIDYQVRRSKRRKKTIQIVLSGGGVRVLAPMKTSDSELQAIVRKRVPWILKHVSQSTSDAEPMRFVSGETLPYLGRNVRLHVEAAGVLVPTIRLDHWRFRVAVRESLSDEERHQSIRETVVRWYQQRAAERLPETVQRWWPRLGRGEMSRVLIRDQRRRWGSCAPDGTLRFNWRAVMLKPALIEYLVVHELAHLTHRNHSKDFWDLVSKVMPDAQQLRKSLLEEGRRLPF